MFNTLLDYLCNTISLRSSLNFFNFFLYSFAELVNLNSSFLQPFRIQKLFYPLTFYHKLGRIPSKGREKRKDLQQKQDQLKEM